MKKPPVSRSAAAPWPGASSPGGTGTSGSRTSSPARWSGRWRSAPGRPSACAAAAGCRGTRAAACLGSGSTRLCHTRSQTFRFKPSLSPAGGTSPAWLQLQIDSGISVGLPSFCLLRKVVTAEDYGQISASCASCSAV